MGLLLSIAVLLLEPATGTAVLPSSDLPPSGGIYHRSAQGWIALPATLLWPIHRNVWPVPVSLRYREAVVRLAAPWAAVQVPERRPTFHVRSFYPPLKWKLLRLSRRGDHRELEVWVDPLQVPAVRLCPDDLREVEFAEVGPNGLALRPTAELEPGEYLLVAPLSGQRRILIGYDFGVAR